MKFLDRKRVKLIPQAAAALGESGSVEIQARRHSALLTGSVMCRAMNDIALAGLWRRRKRPPLDRSPLLAGVATPRADNLVFTRNRRALAGLVDIWH